jgi:predicted RNA-binding Zn-ribbon protein involved in translation (DUF1610 family)
MNVLTNRIGVKEWTQHAHSHPWIGEIGGPRRTIEHPICPRCEKVALRDKKWSTERRARCPSCGWAGVATMRLNEYVENKMYR